MIWSVTYRDKDGQRHVLEIEAADRDALFSELARRNVSPISVMEGKAARKDRVRIASVASSRESRSHRIPLVTIISIILIAGVIGALCWIFLSHGESAGPIDSDTNSVETNKVPKTAVATTLKDAVTTDIEENTSKIGIRLHKGVEVISSSATTNSVDGAVVERLKLADGRTVKVVTLPKPLFENPSDQLIAMALSSQPGLSVAPMPIDCNVEQEFLNSLLTPIKINEDDTDNVKELKANVLEARAYIADEVKAGTSVREVLEDYQRQMNNIADHHLMAVQEVQKIKTEYGIEEARKFAIRVNESLRARGIPEISVPKVDEEQHSNSK